MAKRTDYAAEMERIRSFLSDEMDSTNTMYFTYPHGYDQRSADTFNRLYHQYVRMTFKGQRFAPAVRVLLDSGLVLAMSRAYYCARAEIRGRPGSPVEIFDPERPAGPPVDVRDAFVSLRSLMGRGGLRRRLLAMDPALDGNGDLGEIVQNIQHDGNEARDLARWG